jgi:hypothetical protein
MFDSKYFERYATVILSIPQIDEFEKALPSSQFEGYSETMQRILSAIHNEIIGFTDLLAQTKDVKDIAFIKKETLVKEAIEKSIEDDAQESEVTPDQNKKNLIFLKSQAGNVFFNGDVKDFPEEYLSDLLDLIRKLEDYDITFNTAMHRKIANNNSLKNLFELKWYKTRLIYKHIDKDTVLVIMGSYKNQTNPAKERETLALRLKQSQDTIASLVEDLKDPIKKASIIEENRGIEATLIEQITARSRGTK